MSTFDSSITFRKLQIFCTVADFRSITRAAEHIGIAQPVVTAHIRSLEAKLGAKLVARVGRNIVLTEVGERVLQWATDMVRNTQEMERDIGGFTDGASGQIVVSTSMAAGSYILPEILKDFYKTNPDARVTALISNPSAATEAVRTGACDFALLILDPRQKMDGIVVELHWEEPMVLVAASKSKLVGKSVSAADLVHLPFITPPKGLVLRDAEDEKLQAYGIIRKNVVFELGHPEPTRRLVSYGIGVSFVLQSTVKEALKLGELRVVDTPGIDITVKLALAYRQNKTFSPIQTQLLNLIRASCPSGLRPLRKKKSRLE